MEKLCKIEKCVTGIEDEMKGVNSQLASHEDRLNKVDNSLNYYEQRARNLSIRIFNMSVPAEISKSSLKTADFIYSSILKPILSLACDGGEINSILDVLSLIEYCHVLPPPKKSPDTTPVIVKLSSRLYRQLIFQYKKPFFQQNAHLLPKVNIAEDLTSKNYQQLAKLKADPTIARAWSLYGNLKYVTVTEPNIVKSFSFSN